MQTYQHKCIKCSADYSDTDVDDYLCKSCNEERLIIAKEIDKKHNTKEQKLTGMSALEEIAKVRGRFGMSKDGRNSQLFISAKDAGL